MQKPHTSYTKMCLAFFFYADYTHSMIETNEAHMSNTLNTELLNAMLLKVAEFISARRNSPVKLTAECGRKYVKIVIEDYGQRSVYCFLDHDGNIYKAASWRAPAKHIRGSVFDPDYSWGRALGPYGVAYLR